MKEYAVEMLAGTRITTVHAEDVASARERAWDVLYRPGRYHIAQAWREGGERVRDKTTNQVYMH